MQEEAAEQHHDKDSRPLTPESVMNALSSVQIMSIPLHVSGRAKPHSMSYFRMCCEALAEYRCLNAAMADGYLLDADHLENVERVQMASVKPIVFAGMCLEATLFDLSACLLGDDFAASIDRLNPLGKFLVLAKCVNGEAPSRDHVTSQHIDALVKARNILVHYKSTRFVDADLDKLLKRALEEEKITREAVTKSFKALVLLSLHFDESTFGELHILPSFKKPDYWKDQVPPSLHADVHASIAAHKRAIQKQQATKLS